MSLAVTCVQTVQTVHLTEGFSRVAFRNLTILPLNPLYHSWSGPEEGSFVNYDIPGGLWGPLLPPFLPPLIITSNASTEAVRLALEGKLRNELFIKIEHQFLTGNFSTPISSPAPLITIRPAVVISRNYFHLLVLELIIWPQPCVWSSWASWTSCTRTCGPSFRSRTREVEIEAVWGGEECRTVDGEEKKFCELGKYFLF